MRRRAVARGLVASLVGVALLGGTLPTVAGQSWAAGAETQRVLPVDAGTAAMAPLPEETAANTERELHEDGGTEVGGPEVAAPAAPDELRSGVHYEEAIAHLDDEITFEPGDRVSVGFTPRADDQWQVGGVAPRPLPAGRVSGRAMAATAQGTNSAAEAGDTGGVASPAEAPVDAPVPDEAADIEALNSAAVAGEAAPAVDAQAGPTVAPAATGLTKEVFGFLPYWELSSSSTRLNYDVLSTVAYFSVGSDRYGNLLKKNSDGSTTTGWGGWTSSKMTSTINAAHQKGTRVVLTITMFAWTSSQASAQGALLGSSTARLNLARQAAAAVRDRGADGINLDFEPIASGYADEYAAFIKTVRAELNKIRAGYQLTIDTTGYIGNQPIEAAVGPGAADAIFIMGYDYRTAGSGTAGSIAPIAGPAYDITDTIKAYAARVPASKLILGVPYYGRAWSTDTDKLNAKNISGTKYGSSATVVYSSAVGLAAQHGRRWDSTEQVAWTAYRRQNCTSAYGCVTPWRQVYYDDVAALNAKYDAVIRYGLRGAGIWALGYDDTRTELYAALASKFASGSNPAPPATDTTPPSAGVTVLADRQREEAFLVGWSGRDSSGIAAWDVQVSIDGGAWRAWLTGTTRTSELYPGLHGHGYAFRVRAKDAKGNWSAWNVSHVWTSSSPLVVGGFARVGVDGLSQRTGSDTSATKVGEFSEGDIVSIVGGPRSADGYRWWQVQGPLSSWRSVTPMPAPVWSAAGTSTTAYLRGIRAPNSTTVSAVIRNLTFSGAGAASLGSAGAGHRAFSPNGDGSRDRLTLSWQNSTGLDTLKLRVLRTNGSLVGEIDLASKRAAGAQSYGWDGVVAGARVADGSYVLVLAATDAGVAYAGPTSRSISSTIVTSHGVTVDTVRPTLSAASVSGGLFSPNGDGRLDTVRVQATASGSDSWRFQAAALSASGARTTVRTASGTGAPGYTWNGVTDAGTRAADGRYRLTLTVLDRAGNHVSREWDVTLDTRRAAVAVLSAVPAISPNGDGADDTTRVSWSSDETVSGVVRLVRGSTLLRSWSFTNLRSWATTWNARTASGALLADGVYTFRVETTDPAGNAAVASRAVATDRTAGFLTWSSTLFYPQDGDGYAPSSRVSFALIRSASASLDIVDARGGLVRRVWAGRSLAAGTWGWTWDGRNSAGALVPRGTYRAILTAKSSIATTSIVRTVVADAFSVSVSPNPATAGQTMTVTLRSAEPLSAAPRVTLTQPGTSAVAKTATSLGGLRYKVTFALVAGRTGAASMSISAPDGAGRTNKSTRTITVR